MNSIDIYIGIYLLMAALGLRCFAWASSRWGEWQLLSSGGAWASRGGGVLMRGTALGLQLQ